MQLLDQVKVEYHSFLLSDQMDNKFVARGKPLYAKPHDVRAYLAKTGITTKHVSQLRLRGKAGSLYLLYMHAGEDNSALNNL